MSQVYSSTAAVHVDMLLSAVGVSSTIVLSRCASVANHSSALGSAAMLLSSAKLLSVTQPVSPAHYAYAAGSFLMVCVPPLHQVMDHPPELLQQLQLKHGKLDLKPHRSRQLPANICFCFTLHVCGQQVVHT